MKLVSINSTDTPSNQLVAIHQVGTPSKSLTRILGKGIYCRWMGRNEANISDMYKHQMPFESLEKLSSNVVLGNRSINKKLSTQLSLPVAKINIAKLYTRKKTQYLHRNPRQWQNHVQGPHL